MGIGNHTVTHPDLARLNAAAARNEIDAAQTALAAILGAPPVVLAYPSGEADPTVETDAAAAGIEVAVGNQPGVLETVDDRFLIPCLRVSPGTTPIASLAEMDAARSAQ